MVEAKEETTTEESSECEHDPEWSHMRHVRAEAERLGEMVLSAEARDHLVRAGTEMILAVDAMVPKGLVPPDVREHYQAAKRETILLMKALLDAQLEVIKGAGKEDEEPLSSFHKIDLD